MVDREGRRQYGQLIRQLASGRMTIEEYEDKCWGIPDRQNDPAIREIELEILLLCEGSAADQKTGRPKLSREARRNVARAVLFLQSDKEYRWPKEVWDGSVFLITAFLLVLLFVVLPDPAFAVKVGVAVELGLLWIEYERMQARRQHNKREAAGDTDVWPFLRRAELEDAVRRPRLLNGAH